MEPSLYSEAAVPWSYPEASIPGGGDLGAGPDLVPGAADLAAAADQQAMADQVAPDATAGADAVAGVDVAATKDQGTTGKWYQADKADCSSHCVKLGKTNKAGPEGAHCMSGEVRSASGISQGIKFTYGCWPSCAPQGKHQATSQGGYCYRPGQKQDDDDTDRTVGCYCE